MTAKYGYRVRRCLRVGLLCLAALMVLSWTVVHSPAANAEIALQEQYNLGSEIVIPQVSFTLEQKNVEATALVTTPSGAVYRVEESFVPAQNGVHTLSYVAYDSQGNRHEQQHTFTVVAPLCAVGNARSFVKIGKYAYGNYVIDRPAVLTAISSADKFSYSKIIDLEALNGESFLEFFVTPETLGTNDAYKINVILTDIYDPENFITISIKRGTGATTAAWLQRTSYLTANAPSQPPTGLERNKGDLEINGTMYKLQKNTVWGAGVVFALGGNPGYASAEEPGLYPEKVSSQTMALSLDNENNILYANGQLVTMLSSEMIYGKDVWKGFTTGECMLSIEAVEYNASALNLAITKLGADPVVKDGKINPLYAENLFADTQAPVINLDKPETTPNAICGIAYPLFKATVVDDYSKEVQVQTAVFYDYGTEQQVQVDVTEDGFIPYKAGSYTIEYRCADASGNVTVELVEVEAEPENAPALQTKLSQLSAGIAGQKYLLPAPQFSNARGQTSWYAEIKHTDGKAEYAVNADAAEFFPEYAGKYEVTYFCADYICSDSQTLQLEIAANDQPVFMEEPVLPRYILRGCIYQLPEIDVRVYSDGTPVAATASIYVVEDGGQEKLADYRYVIYAKETVQFIYRLENNGKTTEYKSEILPVLDVGYNGAYRIDKYFVCDGVTAEAGAKRVRLRPETLDGGKATFANALQMFNFALRMSASGFGFESINLYLTDYAHSETVVKLSYENVRGAVYFAINDGEMVRLPSTAFNDKDLPLSLNIANNGTLVMPTGVSSLVYEISTDMNGQPFTGFTDQMAYLTVEVANITDMKRAGVDIFNISTQIISGIYVDNVKPSLSAKSAVGERPAGTEYVLNPVYFADVLDPAASCVMYVTDPSGDYAVTVDGETLDESANPSKQYTLRFDRLGDYIVNYIVRDITGNELTYSYVLKSVDTTPPAVDILNPVKQGKVGSQIPVAKIQISDGFNTPTEEFVVYASVITPQGQTFTLLDEAGKIADSFTVSTSGVYKVSYMVIGPSGNMTVTTYKVDVQ